MTGLHLPLGWHVNESQVREILGENCVDSKQLEKDLCDEDLRDFGLPSLADFNKSKSLFEGPVVLQLSRFRNVSQPKMSDTGNRDGVKRIFLTDGISTISGLAFDELKGITSQTPPGTKVVLKGRIPVEGGFLMLTAKDISVIGGNVEKLVERWLVEKSSFVGSAKSRRVEGAPKWVSFGAKSSKTAIDTKGFKANDVLHTVIKASVDEAFDKERQTRIESAGDGEVKKFSAPSTIPPPSVPKPIEQKRAPHMPSSDRGHDRAKRGRGRNNDEDDPSLAAFLKPAASTLMDFLPPGQLIQNVEPTFTSRLSAKSMEQTSSSRRPTKQETSHASVPYRNNDSGRNVGQGKPERKQFNDRGFNPRSGSGAQAHQNERKQFNERSFNPLPGPGEQANKNERKQFNDGSFTHRSGSGAHAHAYQNDRKQFNDGSFNSRRGSGAQAHQNERKQFNDGGFDSRSGPAQQNGFGKEDRNNRDRRRNQGGANFQRNPRENHQRQQQPPPSFGAQDFPTVDEALVEELSVMDIGQPRGSTVFYSSNNGRPPKPTGPNWTVGQKCQAPWSDGNFYLATVMKLGPGVMSTVRFDEYGDICVVPRDTLLLLK